MADVNVGDLGTDREVAHALDLIVRNGRRDPRDEVVGLALDYLHAMIPANSHARALLLILTDNLDSYRRGLWSGASGITDFEPVADTVHLLRDWLDAAGLPCITRPCTVAELAELAAALGLRGDWHEPDEQGICARPVVKPTSPRFAVSGGTFDNTGHSVLEQTVVIYQDRMPVAEVALATLFAWACDAGRPGPTPPTAGLAVIGDAAAQAA